MFVCLPESGADPTIESDSGFNAMDMAVAMGHRNGMCKLNPLSEATFKAKNHVGKLMIVLRGHRSFLTSSNCLMIR